MKGLLYKDVVLNKTNIGAMVIVIVFLAIELVTANILYDVGTADFSYFFNATMIGGIFALQCGFPIIAMDAGRVDAGSKWINYALALPGGYRYMVSERYILGLIGDGIALVMNFIVVGIANLLFDFKVKLPIMLMLMFFGIMLIIQAFTLLLFSRGKKGIVGMVCLIILISAFLGGLSYLAFGDISALTEKHLFTRIATWLLTHEKRVWLVLSGLIGAGFVLEYLSYRLAVYLYKRD